MPAVTRKERKREQQRGDILLAARDLLLREGSTHFTMRKLAKEVGCAPGTLYLYFKDKDELIAVLVEESFERLMEALERQQSDLGPLEFLEALMREYITFGLDNPTHYYFAFMLHRTPSLEKARPRPHRSYALLCSTLEACIEQSLIAPVDVQMAAPTVWASIHGVTSLMITMPNFPWGRKPAVIDHLVASVLDGLKSPTGRTEGADDDKR
jgi:AcrR family transcriptional regulator